MKTRLTAFLWPLFGGILLSAVLAAVFQPDGPLSAVNQKVEKPSAAEPAPPPHPVAAPGSPAGHSELMGRWTQLASTPAGLAAVDGEIRNLSADDFPDIMESVSGHSGSGGNPLLRLLGIRWAEVDGEAALNWARERFYEKKDPKWGSWLQDLVSTWSACSPAEAGTWLTGILASPDSRERWATTGTSLALESWATPANVVAVARAKLASTNPHVSHTEFGGQASTMSAKITSMETIHELKALLTGEWETKWPERSVGANGVLSRTMPGGAGLSIAAAYEEAWPRVDPAGWRAYAADRVVGATGELLPLQLALDDCRQTDNPAEVARGFLQTPAAALMAWNDYKDLAEAVEEKQPGAGWDLLSGITAPGADIAALQFVLGRHPDDVPAAMARLATLTDPAIRRRAEESCLLRADASAAESWLQSAGWPPDRLAAFHEMQISAPIPRF